MYQVLHNVSPNRRNKTRRNPSGFELVTSMTGVKCITWIKEAQPCQTKSWMPRQILKILAEIATGSPPHKDAHVHWRCPRISSFSRSSSIFLVFAETSNRW
ncbi:unnamed protein product, partial [Sphacelaria rigidula]